MRKSASRVISPRRLPRSGIAGAGSSTVQAPSRAAGHLPLRVWASPPRLTRAGRVCVPTWPHPQRPGGRGLQDGWGWRFQVLPLWEALSVGLTGTQGRVTSGSESGPTSSGSSLIFSF